MKDTGIAINDLVQRFNPLVAAMNALHLNFGGGGGGAAPAAPSGQ
jgi:hypothetical protein